MTREVEPETEWLTVKEYAARRRVSVYTVYSAIRQGRMKYHVERVAAGSLRIRVPRESTGNATNYHIQQ